MQYSYIRSRAGLVALVFALIISLVSAVPIPATESGLSEHKKTSSTARMLTPPAATRALTRRHISADMDDQLVRRSGSKIKHAFQNLGHKIKEGFQNAGKAIKTAAKKVGHFIKTTGAKIAKFGLKVVQSVGNVLSKAVSFIPGVGKAVSRAISGVTTAAGAISDHIHVSLGKKLDKGMNVMNKANQVMQGALGFMRRDRSEEEEAFQHRDISDAYYFEERDDIALEDRDDSYFEAYERDIYERYDLDEE